MICLMAIFVCFHMYLYDSNAINGKVMGEWVSWLIIYFYLFPKLKLKLKKSY